MNPLWHAIGNVMFSWHQGKLFVEHVVQVSHDTLHLVVGVLVWIAAALLIRRPLGAWMPLVWVLVFILWNEAVDLRTERWPDPGMQLGEGAKDVVLTLLLPTLLMFAIRARPELFRAAAKRRK